MSGPVAPIICRDCEKQGLIEIIKVGRRRSHLKEKHGIAVTKAHWNDSLRLKYYRLPTPEEWARFGPHSERGLYEGVKSQFQRLFSHKFGYCLLEVTAWGEFSDPLKDKVRHDIVFTFIKRAKGSEHASPDITGFATDQNVDEFITIEVKNERITLDNVYQAKKYADLLSAKYGFLVSTEPIPAELKRLHHLTFILNRFMTDHRIWLAQWDETTSQLIHNSWFPEPPFAYKPEDLKST